MKSLVVVQMIIGLVHYVCSLPHGVVVVDAYELALACISQHYVHDDLSYESSSVPPSR